MGDTQGKEEKKWAEWQQKAASEGWKCKNCGNIPHYGERLVFFERGLCEGCAHLYDKKD